MHHIYADWAATAPLHPAAIEAIQHWLDHPAPANPSSLHAYGTNAADLLYDARQTIAHAFHQEEEGQLIFTSGGTEGDGIAIWSLLWQYKGTHRHRILLSPLEHPAVREAVYTFAPPMGYTVEECRVTPAGTVDQADFAARLGEDVAFAAVLAVQNETGVIQPIEALAAMTHHCGGSFFSDCVQAAGHIPLPKGPDILTLSGHKFGAPTGTGVLFAQPDTPLFPLLKGGGQEFGIRGGTENSMGICAMAAAAMAVTTAGEPHWMAPTRDRLEAQLIEETAAHGLPLTIAGRSTDRIGSTSCIVLGDTNDIPVSGMPVSAIPVSGIPEGENVVLSCDMAGLAVSAGSACHSGERAPSPTLLAMGYTPAAAIRQIRLSFGWSTTAAEMEQAFAIFTHTLLRQWQL